MKKKDLQAQNYSSDLQSLIQQIKSETSHSHEARYDQKGRLFNSIANNGIKKNQVARLDRGGEYNGITIKALEDGSAQLNNWRICQMLQQLDQKLEIHALQMIDDKFQKYGLPCLYYIVWKWLLKFNFPIPDIIDIQQNQHFENQSKQLLDEIDKYISREYQSPLEIKFSIQSPGYNESLDQSVIPEDWVDREFDNAEQLHREMDLLPWRVGKPKVTYCVTYCLNIIEEQNWQNKVYGKVDQLIHISRNGDQIQSKIIQNLEQFKEDCQYLKIVKEDKSIVIAMNKDEFFQQMPNYDKKQVKVGVLASRLQKCIRRGRYCSRVLVETIKQLSKCKPYVLPEMKMIRVSASRQLLWRLYISTIEDSRPCLPTEGLIDMFSLSCLAIICNNDPDSQLNEVLINIIIKTAVAIQSADTDRDTWDWRMSKQRSDQQIKFKEDQKMIDFEQSLVVAMDFQPMMEGDREMISNYLKIVKQVNSTLKSPFKIHIDKLKIDEQIYSDPKIEREAILASYDMHCFPLMIIQLQGLLPFVSDNFTTDKVSSFIWEYSSKYNVRYSTQIKFKNDQEKLAYQYLRQIQEDLMNSQEQQGKIHQNYEAQIFTDDLIPEHISRLGFLILFGQQFVHQIKNRKYAFSLSGSLQKPWNVKFAFDIDGKQIDDQTQAQVTNVFQEWIQNQTLEITVNQPPFGYVWNFRNRTLKIKINKDGVKLIELDLQVPFFDTSNLLKKRGRIMKQKLDETEELYISELLAIIPQRPNLFQAKLKSDNQKDWMVICQKSKLPIQQIFSILYTRIRMNDQIQFSITRSGNKSNSELSKQYEGMVYRMMHLLQYCYPSAFIKTNNTWHLQKETQSVYDMIEDLKILCQSNKKQGLQQNNFRLVTKLWDHQKQTADRMANGYLNLGKRGFGDASCVGSGKTLTAISTAIQLLETNKQINDSFRAFLVLVPQKLLLQTWIDEIRKHSKGYHLVVQLSNGILQELFEGDKFENKVKKNIPDAAIYKHTIILSTLGRFRDHGIKENKQFYLIIVDECLSIQNNDAFQTQEACKQSLLSKYGCLLLSATFFRSRFDKLFYLLSILQTEIPTNKQYLDTILSECMICYINENQRIWTSDIHKFQLPKQERQQYEQIKQQDLPSDKKYIKLQQIIHQIKIAPFIEELIQKIQSNDKRILIYANSKAEAEMISELPNITLYPNLNGRHVVVSYTVGVYGLNDLVCLDTILTRPPEPDKLPQMKGRLDRPGQQKDQLNIIYFMFENTIEEAGMVRLDIASRFINSYIMPLAQFYNLAINM